MIRVLATKDLANSHPDFEVLKQAFISYKSGTTPIPDIFGKDFPYNRPSAVLQAQLCHVHLKETDSNWPERDDRDHWTSETHLVYCQHLWSEDMFLLVAILTPNAHEIASNETQTMISLANTAERFHATDYSNP